MRTLIWTYVVRKLHKDLFRALLIICGFLIVLKRYCIQFLLLLEAEYCFQLRKPIIPLNMEDGYRADGWLGMLIGTKFFYDFSGRYPFDEKIDGLLKELRTTVSKLDPQVSMVMFVLQPR